MNRATLIGTHLGIARPLSDRATEIALAFQDLTADAKDRLTPEEEARLLSEIMVQISGRLVVLNGGR